ncbi:hypothetical protein Lfu02_64600 [Longispora fulva]|uniref:Uncharacterized protein n=1 Tax=Longispora fulva TaxID=619741 RepID=A0A8J7GHS4_9ACTN|nr:hypothetical protein [Longispora fulva]MBG6137755.1 hypothetical protein [Longispora fulva]GIG62088.1 hypothetical protein Lfu02_64600 [Longispora fulva]
MPATVTLALALILGGVLRRRRRARKALLASVRTVLASTRPSACSALRAGARDVVDAVVRIDRAASGVRRSIVRLTGQSGDAVAARAMVANDMRRLLDVEEPRTALLAHTRDRADVVTAATVLAAATPPEHGLGGTSLRSPPMLAEAGCHPMSTLAAEMYRDARRRLRALHRLLIAARSLPTSGSTGLPPADLRALAEALRVAACQVSDAGLRIVNGRPLAAVRLLVEVDLLVTDDIALGHYRALADLGSAHRVAVVDWALAAVTALHRRQLDRPRQP